MTTSTSSALTQTEGAAEVSPPFVKPTMNLKWTPFLGPGVKLEDGRSV
jgi:hypothetical protein